MTEQKTHAERHPNDIPAPEGFVKVRLDEHGSKVPYDHRIYMLIHTGYGAGRRVRQARQTGRQCGAPVQLIHNDGSPFVPPQEDGTPSDL